MSDLPTTGYPLTMRVPYTTDGPLVIHAPGERLEFTVEDSVVSVSTQARAAALVRYTGAVVVPTEDSPPAGSGDQPPAGGSKRSRRSSAPSTDPEG